MPPPTNLTPATAMPLALGVPVTLDVSGAPATEHEVWFRYTAQPADLVLGFYAGAPAASNYDPMTVVFSGTPEALVPHMDIEKLNGPVQLPVTVGTTYYFRIQQFGVGVPDNDLTVRLERAPNAATLDGALAVNDDLAGGFPLAILSPTTGAVLQFRTPFPAGDTAAILPDGRSLWQDDDAAVVRLYDAALVERAATPWTYLSVNASPIASNRVNRFYLGGRGGTAHGNARVVTVDATTGALGSTVWELPSQGLMAMAVSRDDSVLYHYGQVSYTDTTIRRWDLVANTALAPLAGAVAANHEVVRQILVLADETIVVGYVKTTAPTDGFVRRYAADGTLLNTYTVGASPPLHLLAHATDDPASFWIWRQGQGAATGQSRFERIQVSGGGVLVGFDVPLYKEGHYLHTTPPAGITFGVSDSCPFLSLPQALTPVVTPPDEGPPLEPDLPPLVAPSYFLDARYIRRLRRAPHVSAEHVQLTYRRLQVDLEPGVGVVDGQGADPEVLLRMSRDGGHTWGEPLSLSAGPLGAYATRVIARRLGVARDAVFEIVVSDPVAWHVIGAWLDVDPGTH